MTAEPMIDYEALAQDAMRGVVRTVLQRTAKSGLPGDHHFYISFDTQVPGVALSKRLKEKYPSEMTIVLQHRFWDLNVFDERFEVKLTFDGIPERLVVPFVAIKVFFDPSVRYGLQFEEPEFSSDMIDQSVTSLDDGASPRGHVEQGPRTAPPAVRPARRRRTTPAPVGDSSSQETSPAAAPELAGAETSPEPARRNERSDSEPAARREEPGKRDKDSAAPAGSNGNGATVVSLDAFRKK